MIAKVIGVDPWRLTPFALYRAIVYIMEKVGQKLAAHQKVMRRKKEKRDRKKKQKKDRKKNLILLRHGGKRPERKQRCIQNSFFLKGKGL